MRTFFVVTAMAATLMAGAASAATVSAQIKSIVKGRTVTMADGKTYQLGPNIKADKLKSGEKISVSYDKAGAKSIITRVEPAK